MKHLEVVCKACNGRGTLPHPSVLRAMRERTGMTLREVARRMMLSASYVSDLELGKRAVTDAVVKRYARALRPKKRRVLTPSTEGGVPWSLK